MPHKWRPRAYSRAMCDCVPPSQRVRADVAPTWLASTNGVIHPDAPQGGGGAGFFRSPGVFASDGDLAALPHPDSAAAATLDPVQVQQAQALQAAAAARKPPPLVAADGPEQDIQGMKVTVLQDAYGIENVGDATTDMRESGGGASFSGDIGNFTWQVFPWTVTIQTLYGKAQPDADSLYGRGTTPSDITDGNVSLGFHESCHRQDLLDYLKNNAPPVFTGVPKMTTAQANAAISSYKTACAAYFAKGRSNSVDLTDETPGAAKKKSQVAKKK